MPSPGDMREALRRKREERAAQAQPPEPEPKSPGDGMDVNFELMAAASSDAHYEPGPYIEPPLPPHEERRIVPMQRAFSVDIHRPLLHSLEAEQGVLSSLLIEPKLITRVLTNDGVAHAWFHVPAHQTIFDVLVDEWRSGAGTVDMITFTQVLRDRCLLESLGGTIDGEPGPGAWYITKLYNFVPSAANIDHYLMIVRDKYLRRELIRFEAGCIQRAQNESAGLDELMSERRKATEVFETLAGSHSAIEGLLKTRRFDQGNPPMAPEPVWTLDGAVIATPGNLMAIQAKAKAGKTAVLGAMMASAIGPNGDTFAFGSANHRELALLHFDTEQSPWDHHQCMLRVLHRAQCSNSPPWLYSYRVADVPLEQRLQMLRSEIERAHKAHGGLFAVIIDGIGDLCVDPNDPVEAFSLVDEMHQLSIKWNTCIVAVLHENPGTDTGKTRGHLGSQLERKAETNLRLEKNNQGVTLIFAERARNAHIPKDRGVKFEWNDEAKMHLTSTAEFTRAGSKKERGEPRINDATFSAKDQLGRYFKAGASVRRSVLASTSKIKESTFDKYWRLLQTGKLIRRNAAVQALWEATEEWSRELEATFTEDD